MNRDIKNIQVNAVVKNAILKKESSLSKKSAGYPSIDNPQNNGATLLEKYPIIPNISVYTAIKSLSFFYQKEEAINCLDLSVNYKKLLNDSVTISLALKELGVGKGEIVSICMPNFYQAVASFLACNRIGAVTTFLNSYASEEEINSYLNLFESPVFINFNKTREENFNTKKNTGVKHIITLDKKNINSTILSHNYHITSNDDMIDFNSLESIAAFQKKGCNLGRSQDNSLILFTSGTTGKPKSVVLTNQNILASGIYLKNSSNIKNNTKDRRTLVCVPFSYPYGFGTSTLMTLLSGKTAILAPNISKDTICYYLKKEPNIIFGSPALLELIMRNTPKEQDLSSITTFISGGDFLTPTNNARGKEFFYNHGAIVELGNGSGNAETVACGTNPVGVQNRPETAGKILTGTNAIIINEETMKEEPYGKEGLLCVFGKHVFKEYYKDPELTQEVKFIKNGKEYFKTGTLGFIDKDGYFTITGRQSRFYITSSLNKVYCDHIQNIISQFACVKDCAIVKVPDNTKLYVNKAYIVLDKEYEEEFALKYITELCKKPIIHKDGTIQQLKDYEIPTYIEFIPTLPRKQGTEKVDYHLLEEDAKKEVGNSKKLNLKINLKKNLIVL